MSLHYCESEAKRGGYEVSSSAPAEAMFSPRSTRSAGSQLEDRWMDPSPFAGERASERFPLIPLQHWLLTLGLQWQPRAISVSYRGVHGKRSE